MMFICRCNFVSLQYLSYKFHFCLGVRLHSLLNSSELQPRKFRNPVGNNKKKRPQCLMCTGWQSVICESILKLLRLHVLTRENMK